MQSLLIARLTFARTPEDPTPAVSGTSPPNGSSETRATFQQALIRPTSLSPSEPLHVGVSSAGKREAARRTKCHLRAGHGLPGVTTAVAPQRAWLALADACGTVVPGRPGMRGWPFPMGYASLFLQLSGEEPRAKTEYTCRLSLPLGAPRKQLQPLKRQG